VAGLFARSFGRWLGPYKGGLAALAGIGLYTLLVGAEAAVVRAAIMGGISLLAGLVGRRQGGVYALGVTAGLMALDNLTETPGYLFRKCHNYHYPQSKRSVNRPFWSR
jgi:competence protein ComEC